MHKPSISRMGLLMNIAAMTGLYGVPEHTSTAQYFKAQRGPAPAGKRWRDHGIYIPGGANPNVEPTRVRNPKVAANVQMMHEKWFGRFPVFPMKMEPDPNSISSIKKATGHTRHRIRAGITALMEKANVKETPTA